MSHDPTEPAVCGVAMTVTGPAIFGHNPDQILCWKPCCKSPVRLRPEKFESWLPVVVRCDRPRCKRRWTVEFPQVPAGHDRVAIWRLV